MTESPRDRQAASEAKSRAQLQALRLHEIATEAGERACAESKQDARNEPYLDAAERQYQDLTGTDKAFKESAGTCACPRCGHRFDPDPMDFKEVGPIPCRQDGDGPRDRVIECPGCGATIDEFALEEI